LVRYWDIKSVVLVLGFLGLVGIAVWLRIDPT
jgi:hypothetical protein